MKELTDLFLLCLKEYNNCQPCDDTTCQCGFYCTVSKCDKGFCSDCIRHIQRSQSPKFHYSCPKITYHYVLRFFNRFASEIAYIFSSLRTDYLQAKTKLNVVSLGCGPGSEIYGIIKGLSIKAPHIVLDYQGFDLSGVWYDVQQISKHVLSQTSHRVAFYNLNMFGAFNGFDDEEVDMLVLNYLLSDSLKYYNDHDKLKFINEIVQFVIDNNIKNILFNDIGYYGNGGLDSGVGMMLCMIKELKSYFKVKTIYRCFLSDKYIPNSAWESYKEENLLFKSLPENTLDTNINCCKSKQILVHLS